MPLMDNLKRFVRGEDYVDDDPYYSEEAEPERAAANGDSRPEAAATTRWRAPEPAAEPVAAAPAAPAYSAPSFSAPSYTRPEPEKGRVVNMAGAAQMSVVLVTPDRYANAGEIAKHLLDKRTVVLNMERTNREVARRLLDFLGGVAFAQNGKVRRVANSTFIITPASVELEGELESEAEEGEEIIGQE